MSHPRPTKRVRLASAGSTDDEDAVEGRVVDLSEESSSDDEEVEEGATDEDEAIRGANRDAHAKKPKKRRRALSPEAFGTTLTALLDAPAPTAKQIANLHRPARRAHADEAIERKALRLVQASRHAHEERGHVTDIIAGWPARPAVPFKDWPNLEPEQLEAEGGAESERALRRLAQKGVVKLFNAIRAAQGVQPTAGAAGSSASSVGGKKRKEIAAKEETPDAVASTATQAGVSKTAPNLLGQKGKEQALTNLSKASFLEILKTGKGTRSTVVPSVA